MSLGLAAESAHRGITYDADNFVAMYCGSPSAASWEDIIDNKLKEPPVTVQKN